MGLSDAAYKEFGYLDRRSLRMRKWVFANCGNKRDPSAPPCQLAKTDIQNFGDFMARWINFANDVERWAVNKESIFGSSIDENAMTGWRKEFDAWEKILRQAGFERDATAPPPKPDEPPAPPPAGGALLAQLKPLLTGVVIVAGIASVGSLAKTLLPARRPRPQTALGRSQKG